MSSKEKPLRADYLEKVKIRDVIVEGVASLIITCPVCGREGWCYPGQAQGILSIVCDEPGCHWHETHNWWNYYFAQELVRARVMLNAARAESLREAQAGHPADG